MLKAYLYEVTYPDTVVMVNLESPISIIPFVVEKHLDETVDILFKVRETDFSFPPTQDVSATREGFSEWLLDEVNSSYHWVAVIDNVIVGHVRVSSPHEYLTDYVASVGYEPVGINGLLEVGKVFVNPNFRNKGIGGQLLTFACDHIWYLNAQPSLAVVSTSVDAIRLYKKTGWLEVGVFNGIHGKNHVLVKTLPLES